MRGGLKAAPHCYNECILMRGAQRQIPLTVILSIAVLVLAFTSALPHARAADAADNMCYSTAQYDYTCNYPTKKEKNVNGAIVTVLCWNKAPCSQSCAQEGVKGTISGTCAKPLDCGGRTTCEGKAAQLPTQQDVKNAQVGGAAGGSSTAVPGAANSATAPPSSAVLSPTPLSQQTGLMQPPTPANTQTVEQALQGGNTVLNGSLTPGQPLDTSQLNVKTSVEGPAGLGQVETLQPQDVNSPYAQQSVDQAGTFQSYAAGSSFAQDGSSVSSDACANIMTYACLSSVAGTVGGTAQEALGTLGSDVSSFAKDIAQGSGTTAQNEQVFAQIGQATDVLCRSYDCNGSTDAVAQAISGVCMQESQCDPERSHPGSVYQGLPQTDVAGMEADYNTLDAVANDQSMSAADRAQVQSVLDQYDKIEADGGDPRKDPVVGAWLLTAQQFDVSAKMGDNAASPVEAITQITSNPLEIAAGLQISAQLAPVVANGSLDSPDSSLPSSAISALRNNIIPVSYGDSYNNAVGSVLDTQTYTQNFEAGIAAQQAVQQAVATEPSFDSSSLAYAMPEGAVGAPSAAGDISASADVAPASATDASAVQSDAPLPPARPSEADLLGIDRNLRPGSSGSDVAALQTYLQQQGYFPANVQATGYYGSVTQAAVAAWQKANRIAAGGSYGYFGPLSRAAL